MKVITRQTIHAPPAVIWEVIHEPGNMPAWNPKCLASEPLGRPEIGQKFSVSYQMNRQRTDAVGELVACEPERMIHFRYHYEDAARIGIVDEVFELFPEGDRTRLVHAVDFSRSTLPFWLKLLVGLLGRFGQQRGKGPIDGIASLVER